MNAILEFLNSHSGILLLLVLFVLLFILYQFNQISKKLSLQKKKYDMLLRGRGELNMGDLIQAHSQDIFEMDKKVNELAYEVEKAKKSFAFPIQKIGFVKYNAFDNIGNNLSFAFTLLDGKNNGFCLSSVYGRNESRIFAKPVVDGKCLYSMSEEEKESLRNALHYTGIISPVQKG